MGQRYFIEVAARKNGGWTVAVRYFYSRAALKFTGEEFKGVAIWQRKALTMGGVRLHLEKAAKVRRHAEREIKRHHPRIDNAEHVGKDDNRLSVRVMVTGHWRNQPFGTGLQERRLIWIRPYWKGPPGAPISNARRIVT